jgi:hypothetical protein
MRWLRRLLVALVLAAPIAVVAALAWPGPDEDSQDVRREGSGPDGTLLVGDRVDGHVDPGGVADYPLAADQGAVRIAVRGVAPFDATLAVLGPGDDELAYNDDTVGLDPEVEVVSGGEELVVRVGGLGGNPGDYTVVVDG